MSNVDEICLMHEKVLRQQVRKQTLEEVIRYIKQQKVNYGNKNIFNNQIKFIRAMDK